MSRITSKPPDDSPPAKPRREESTPLPKSLEDEYDHSTLEARITDLEAYRRSREPRFQWWWIPAAILAVIFLAGGTTVTRIKEIIEARFAPTG